ncbi:MAG: preprotein translocase subunit TatB [Syntrophus sp. (in: bacteria)]|nr:preprotein translocase subunit TatB [Syntrophus sp. (in: bacteria)]
MASTIDARGLSCPQPVIMTMSEMARTGTGDIVILVDTDTSKENVMRAATGKEWNVAGVDRDGEGYRITISRV